MLLKKKYEAILDSCLSNSNTPKYSNKIPNYEIIIKNNKKKHFRDLENKEKINTEIEQKDCKEKRILNRKWKFNDENKNEEK